METFGFEYFFTVPNQFNSLFFTFDRVSQPYSSPQDASLLGVWQSNRYSSRLQMLTEKVHPSALHLAHFATAMLTVWHHIHFKILVRIH